MERCWKIHGYPPNYRPNTWKKETVGKANTVQTNTQHEERHIEPKLTQEQYNTLMSFLSTQPDTNSKEPSMATSAHFEGQCSLYVSRPSTWILDSGVSDHICCDSSLFRQQQFSLRKTQYYHYTRWYTG